MQVKLNKKSKKLTPFQKKVIDNGLKKVIREYGEVLKWLGRI